MNGLGSRLSLIPDPVVESSTKSGERDEKKGNPRTKLLKLLKPCCGVAEKVQLGRGKRKGA